MNIKLSKKTYLKLEEKIKNTLFESVEEYINHKLENEIFPDRIIYSEKEMKAWKDRMNKVKCG